MDRFREYMPQVVFYMDQVPVRWRDIVNVVFIVVMFVGLWCLHYSIRRAMGQRRFKGHWYSRAQFEALLQELYSGVRGGRLPDSETMRMLDRHIYGSRGSTLRDINGAGWL